MNPVSHVPSEWGSRNRVPRGTSLSNHEIAVRVFVSPGTVKAHVAHILQRVAYAIASSWSSWCTSPVSSSPLQTNRFRDRRSTCGSQYAIVMSTSLINRIISRPLGS
ncbi:LuxR C-terminal-related transcriptional regulator [Aeromicrobium sp.]